MGSVSSLIPDTINCSGSDHKNKKVFRSKKGGQVKPNFEINNDAAVRGNSEDFFYIKVSHKSRGDDMPDDVDLRKAQTEFKATSRFEASTENSFTSQFLRSSTSSVETHNSLSIVLGPNFTHVPKSQTPEPKHDMNSGSPCDSGISSSSCTNEGDNSRTKWTGGVNGDGGTSHSSTRSTSTLSDCLSGPAILKTETRNVKTDHTSTFTDRNCPSSMECGGSVGELLYSSEVSQLALQAQAPLKLQVLQLQQDKDRLQEEVYQLIRHRDAAESQLMYKLQQTQITPTLEETQWEVCLKAGEISLLKQQLKDLQADVTNKLTEIVSLKSTLRETKSNLEDLKEKHHECEETLHLRSTDLEVCENELRRKKNEAELLREKAGKLQIEIKTLKQDLLVSKEEHDELLKLKVQLKENQHLLQICKSKMANQETSSDTNMLQKDVERLSEQLEEEKEKKEKILSRFHREKQMWNKEKDKVICYQKQLQFNYLHMLRKIQELENQLKERTAKVENRTEKNREWRNDNLDVLKTDVCHDELVATEI